MVLTLPLLRSWACYRETPMRHLASKRGESTPRPKSRPNLLAPQTFVPLHVRTNNLTADIFYWRCFTPSERPVWRLCAQCLKCLPFQARLCANVLPTLFSSMEVGFARPRHGGIAAALFFCSQRETPRDCVRFPSPGTSLDLSLCIELLCRSHRARKTAPHRCWR